MTVCILISPAKKMRMDADSFSYRMLPSFFPRTERILARHRTLSYEEPKQLWRCNEQIANQNMDRLESMDLRRSLTPLISVA